MGIVLLFGDHPRRSRKSMVGSILFYYDLLTFPVVAPNKKIAGENAKNKFMGSFFMNIICFYFLQNTLIQNTEIMTQLSKSSYEL